MHSILIEPLKRVADELGDLPVPFAVVGGLAVSVRCAMRATEDVDVAVPAEDDAEIDRIGRHFMASGHHLLMYLMKPSKQRTAVLRLLSPVIPPGWEEGERPIIDLIFGSCGIEAEVVAEATPEEIADGLILPTARIPHLIAMKCLSESDQRLQDRIDLQHLVQSATPADFREVPPLLELITQRGYAGPKDLASVFAEYRSNR